MRSGRSRDVHMRGVGRLRVGWRTTIGVLAGLVAFTATATLALTREGTARSSLPVAPLSTLGPLRPATPPGSPGPEDAPVPGGAPLAAPGSLHAGDRVDGIACEAGEGAALHVHAHLAIEVGGRSRRVPAGVGVAPPYDVEATPRGPFVAGGSCIASLHTHASDGIVHVESPVRRTFTLGELFDVWGQPLDRGRVGPAVGRVTALLDGRVFTGSPRAIPLLAHAQIELEVGRPLVAPGTITFPRGL